MRVRRFDLGPSGHQGRSESAATPAGQVADRPCESSCPPPSRAWPAHGAPCVASSRRLGVDVDGDRARGVRGGRERRRPRLRRRASTGCRADRRRVALRAVADRGPRPRARARTGPGSPGAGFGIEIIRRLAQHVDARRRRPRRRADDALPPRRRVVSPLAARPTAARVSRASRSSRATWSASSRPSSVSRAMPRESAAGVEQSGARPSRRAAGAGTVECEPSRSRMPEHRPLQCRRCAAVSRSRPGGGDGPRTRGGGVARPGAARSTSARRRRASARPGRAPTSRASASSRGCARSGRGVDAAQLQTSYQREPGRGERGVGLPVAARLHVRRRAAGADRGARARAGACPARRSARTR